MNIKEFRQKYPEYNDMSDEELSKSFHQKFYSDMDYKEFSNKFIGESKSIELFPTFDKPPAEIPTTGAGLS